MDLIDYTDATLQALVTGMRYDDWTFSASARERGAQDAPVFIVTGGVFVTPPMYHENKRRALMCRAQDREIMAI